MTKFSADARVYVYILADGNGRHKIGISNDIETRKKQIEYYDCIKTELLYWRVFLGTEGLEIERLAHAYIADRRDRPKTDWFWVSYDEAYKAVEDGIKAHSTGYRFPRWKEREILLREQAKALADDRR